MAVTKEFIPPTLIYQPDYRPTARRVSIVLKQGNCILIAILELYRIWLSSWVRGGGDGESGRLIDLDC